MVQHNSATKLILTEGSTPQDVLGALVAQDVVIEKFEIALPTLDEIFIKVVKEESE
jgi:ABC-2 type transport system ATP-binding protein